MDLSAAHKVTIFCEYIHMQEIFSLTSDDDILIPPVKCNSWTPITSVEFKVVKMDAAFTEYVSTGMIPVHYHNTAIINSSDITRILQCSFSKGTNKQSISIVHIHTVPTQYQYIYGGRNGAKFTTFIFIHI